MRLFIAFICLFCLSSCDKSALRPVKVLKLFDGDSFLVQDYPCSDCENFQVRLVGIDAPESSQKPWGTNSRIYLDSLISEDRIIYLEYDLDKLDRYKRHLAYAYADKEKQVLINEEMIKQGHAEIFAFVSDLKYLDKLKRAEISAKKSEIGIWDKDNYLKVSPYEYRRKQGKK